MSRRDAQRQTLRTTEGQVGSTRAMPDDRVLVTLDDGRSVVIDAKRLEPQDDGTYLLKLSAADSLTAR
jgi:hypothetical protein